MIEVRVSPTSQSVLLGNSQMFAATVTGTSNTTVSWSVNGTSGGNAASGTITAAGVYTAPADLPTPANAQVTATSVADPSKSATSTVTIASDIVVRITPNLAPVELGAIQVFGGSVTSSGHPDATLRWTISGATCPNECGAIDANGNFTAPQILPSPMTLTVTAQSAADASKQASAAITLTSNFTLTISAPQSVPAGGTAAIVATFTPVPGSNPSQSLTWSLYGPGCSGASCGTLTATTTQLAGSFSNSATYMAPSAAPSPNTVTITVTPQADASKAAHASLTIAQGFGVSVSPGTATLAADHRITLTPVVSGFANTNLLWNVNGVSGGNSALGQICAVGSNPCQAVPSASAAPVDYLAPGAIPAANPVTVQVVSAADSTKSAAAQITVTNHVLVSVLPASVTLSPLAVQSFTASVLGTTNQNVIWQIAGTGCSAGGQVCGSINGNGTYTAPQAAPSPDAMQVVAVSQDDVSQSGAANVVVSTGVNILRLHPASVYAGAAQGFTLRLDGSGFVPAGATAGTSVIISGTARPTACISVTECTAPVTASDVVIAGNVSIQARNPDGTQSNILSLVVALPNSSDATVSLSTSAPNATSQDIVVVDPTTAGISMPGDDVDLDVAALGAFSGSNNSCILGGNPVTLQRPANGSLTADLCLFSESGLDASMTVTVSGPADITVIGKQPAGLGILHITLLLPANATPGARTIFIQTTNLDKTAATGSVEIL